MILRRIAYGAVAQDSIIHVDGRFYRPTKTEVGETVVSGILDAGDPREVWEVGEPEPLQDWMYVKELEFSDSCKRRKLA